MMRTYLLKELKQSQTRQPQPQPKNNTDKNIVFKSCPHFSDCISEINNTQVDNAKDIDAVMPI